jgi:hypothetical protein
LLVGAEGNVQLIAHFIHSDSKNQLYQLL